MSQLVDTLVRRGLVARTADPSDRRNNQLKLTEQGRRCLHEAASRALAVERELTAELDADKVNQLKSQLSGLLAALSSE